MTHDIHCDMSKTLIFTNSVCCCSQLSAARAEAYKQGWEDATKVAVEQTSARLHRNPRPTSAAAVARNVESLKGLRRLVYNTLAKAPLGLTDFDLETATGRSHQSVSAARNALMMAGLVTDSGKTRPNARGNASIVWMLSSPSSKETNAHGTASTVTDIHSCSDTRPRYTCNACITEGFVGS